MLKGTLLFVVLGLLAMYTTATFQRGCRDLRTSAAQFTYQRIPMRDMRRQIVLRAQRPLTARLADSISVPIQGREVVPTDTKQRLEQANLLVNPVAPDDSSIARGERKFRKVCVPCHGVTLAGNGPVAANFMPPPDLLASLTRGRKDGYIYTYIRHGGLVMPSYGPQVTAQEAWDVINYIRYMQRTNPR